MNDHVNPTLARVLNGFALDMEQDNAKAAQQRDERDWATLKQLIERHGVSNVIGIASDLVLDMSVDDNDDYALAAEVLAAAALGCDMPYGAVPQVLKRKRAISDFKDAAMRVRA